MIYLFVLGGLFLSWSFGRNNLSNVFGTAIGTRMVPFKLAAFLTGISVFFGALLSGTHTTTAVHEIGVVHSGMGAFILSISVALTILINTQKGIPVSIAQSVVGALVGWNLFFELPMNIPILKEMLGAWFYGPIMACVIAIVCFMVARWGLKTIHIPILYQDMWIRLLLILCGTFAAYFLGANNMSVIVGIFAHVPQINQEYVLGLCGLCVALGAWMADKKVITNISRGLYPLSPMEALVVVFACGVTLYCFSGTGLQTLLNSLNLPSVPLVPLPTSGVLIGTITGVGLAKGHKAIKWESLGKVALSWIFVPILSGLICWSLLAILIEGGQIW